MSDFAPLEPEFSAQARRWRAWLRGPACRDPATGLWRSWVDPSDPGSGYPYEEATAWALLAGVGDDDAMQALRDILRSRPLGRDGRGYLFDTAVALQAALARVDARTITAALPLVGDFLSEGRAVTGGPTWGEESRQTRWSDSFGLHILWVIGPLTAVGMRGEAVGLLNDLWPTLHETWRDCGGYLPPVHQGTGTRYAHAAAYAAEGLQHVEEGREGAIAITTALLELAARHDGLVPAYCDHGPLRADAAAQTLGLALWLGIEHPAKSAIFRALQRLTTDEGGIRYDPESRHVNTCATAFAVLAEARNPRSS